MWISWDDIEDVPEQAENAESTAVSKDPIEATVEETSSSLAQVDLGKAAAPAGPDMLTDLPVDLVLHVASYLDPTDGCMLIQTCKALYNLLVMDMYKRAGTDLCWLPLFAAAGDGNFTTMERCLSAGARIDTHWFVPLLFS